MFYNVYIMEYESTPTTYLTLFVQSGPSFGGVMHYVRGSIEAEGMTYAKKQVVEPTTVFESFLSLQCMGIVQKEDVFKLNSICESIAPPAKQIGPDGPINPGAPQRRSREWVFDVYEKLKADNVIDTTGF